MINQVYHDANLLLCGPSCKCGKKGQRLLADFDDENFSQTFHSDYERQLKAILTQVDGPTKVVKCENYETDVMNEDDDYIW